MRYRRLAALVVGALTASLVTFAPSTASADDSARAKKSAYVFAHGRIGPLKVGMTPRRALKTGLVKYVDQGCGPKLVFKGKKRGGHLFLDVYKKRIDRIYALRGNYRTTRGIRLGSKLATLYKKYPKASKPKRTVEGNWDVLAHTGPKGKHRKWLVFGFSSRTNNKPTSSSKVKFFFVGKGQHPSTYADGC